MPVYLCAQAIKQGLTPPGRVLLIGDPQSEVVSRRLGLIPHQRLTPPMGRIRMLSREVQRISKQYQRVICWSDELAPLMRGLHADAELISTRPDLAQKRVSSRVDVRVFERSDRSIWESRNHQAELDTVLTPLIQNPPPLPSVINRSSLGLEPQDLCIGVIADQPSQIDARSFGFLMGLLHVAGFRLTAVIPSGASHLTSARRHHHGLGRPFRLLVSTQPMLTMLNLFDVLIHPCFDGSGSSHLIERLCENSDTPVLRLRHCGRSGLSRAPGVAGPIIEELDDIMARRAPDPIRQQREIHV